MKCSLNFYFICSPVSCSTDSAGSSLSIDEFDGCQQTDFAHGLVKFDSSNFFFLLLLFITYNRN